MDIVYLAAVVVAALTLPRPRAQIATIGLWALCVALVGWGPAKSDGVHVATLGFWIPWVVVLLIGVAVAAGIGALRQRRSLNRA